MSEAESGVTEALAVIREYFRRFYRNEPNGDIAGTAAIRAMIGKHAEEWLVARAFRTVIGAPFAPGYLRGFVCEHAGRDLEDDAEAREFLQEVYDGNAMDLAFDPNLLIDDESVVEDD
jgi:hypothetical protein